MTDLELYAQIAQTMSKDVYLAPNGMALPYRLFAPDEKPGETYPLVVFLHGMGQRGRDNEAQVTQTSGAFLYALPEHQAETPCYILAPQCPEDIAWAHPGVPELLKELIDKTIAECAVDPMRVSVTGLSMGGYGTWNMIGRYPGFFSAAMPICGAGALEVAKKVGQLPVWAFHAADDPTVPVASELHSRTSANGAVVYGSRLMVTACRAAGSMNVRYTEYPAGAIGAKWYGAHAAWEEAYRDDAVRRWLLSQNRLDQYEYKSVAPGAWEIADAMSDSFYVVDGRDRALAIDTGMARGDIRAVIEQLTPRPYSLALTHGHGDHSFHAPLFDRVSLAEADIDMLYAHKFEGQTSPDTEKIAYLSDGDEIDLGGGISVRVIALPGHTPGSVLFVDEARKCVFMGDAIGSGCGVWMQVPGALPLSDYAKSIAAAKEKLVFLGVEPAGWAFLGGHASQKYQSAVGGYNPPSFEMMDDLIALCEKLIAGEIVGSEDSGLSPEMRDRFGRTLKAAYGKAEMLYRPEQLK